MAWTGGGADRSSAWVFWPGAAWSAQHGAASAVREVVLL
jgi:hypothetical protein